MKHICATLLLLCNSFTGDYNKEFIDKVTSCALEYNSILDGIDRLPINLVVAQAILESNWGKSRFARNGNNLFGIRAVNNEEFIYSANLKKVKKYPTFCSSVKEELIRQWMLDSVDIPKLINHLDNYAEDNQYKSKLIKIINQL